LTLLGCDGNDKQVDNTNLDDTLKNYKKVDVKEENIDYKIFPTDESKSDPTLVTFISNLKNIVSKKETTGLFEALDTAIIVSYGGGIHGIKGFSAKWELEKPDNSELWAILNQILNLGGTWENDDDRYFCIPYTQSNKAFRRFKFELEPYRIAVCISAKSEVYQEPNISSKKIASLNYNIVLIEGSFMKTEFTKISTMNNKIQGYVKTADLIYSAAEHLEIKKVDNSWKITAFAPYD